MVDSNLTIFSRIAEQAFAFTSDRFLDKTDMIGKQLDSLAQEIGGSFFRYMAQRGKFIDVETTTGDFSKGYPKLSESMWDQKASKGLVGGSYGQENRFYFFTGALEKDLKSSGPTTTAAILGKSTFRGLKSDKFSEKRTVFRYGRGSGRGGQFGRIADISTTVEIDLFSKVKTASDVPDLVKGSSIGWAYKLGLLDERRPLLAAYFTWFIDNEVEKQFLMGIKTKKWKKFDE